MNPQLDQFVRLEGVAQVTELADVGRADAVDAELDQSIEREVVVAEIVEFPDVGAGYVVDGPFEGPLRGGVRVGRGSGRGSRRNRSWRRSCNCYVIPRSGGWRIALLEGLAPASIVRRWGLAGSTGPSGNRAGRLRGPAARCVCRS